MYVVQNFACLILLVCILFINQYFQIYSTGGIMLTVYVLLDLTKIFSFPPCCSYVLHHIFTLMCCVSLISCLYIVSVSCYVSLCLCGSLNIWVLVKCSSALHLRLYSLCVTRCNHSLQPLCCFWFAVPVRCLHSAVCMLKPVQHMCFLAPYGCSHPVGI